MVVSGTKTSKVSTVIVISLLTAAAVGVGAWWLNRGKADTVAVSPGPAPVVQPVRVEMLTSMGRIVLELDGAKAPKSVENFLTYVRDGYYAGTIFHRVIDGFMIQGGGFALEGGKAHEKSTRPSIVNEGQNGLKNVRGSIAMARTAEPNSATAQFYINLVDNARLDYPGRDGYGYAVFGRVVEGLDVVDRIGKSPTGTRVVSATGDNGAPEEAPFENVPLQDVVIQGGRVL